MPTKWIQVLAGMVLLGFGILIGRSIHRTEIPAASVIGFSRTNGTSSRALVNFENRSRRTVNVAYRIRAYTTNGWVDANDQDPEAGVLWVVNSGCSHVFSVPPPRIQNRMWVVKCDYQNSHPSWVTLLANRLGASLFHRELVKTESSVSVSVVEE